MEALAYLSKDFLLQKYKKNGSIGLSVQRFFKKTFTNATAGTQLTTS